MSKKMHLLEDQQVPSLINTPELQAVVAGFSGIILHLDRDHNVQWANSKAHELAADPVGGSCCRVLGLDGNDCGSCFVKKSMETGEIQTAVLKGNLEGESLDYVVYEITSSPVCAADKVTGAMVMATNITERYELEKSLRQNQKMEAVGTLARGIAHDFNNILTPIIGYSEIVRMRMQQQDIQDDSVDEYLEEILIASRRAQGLVEQMLRCSSNARTNVALTHVHGIVEEVANLMRTMLPSTIRIQTKIDTSCGRISIDESHLQQILMNLCRNSSNAIGDAHGQLTLSLESEPVDVSGQAWLKITVEDSGGGIAPELLDRIFEPYFTTREKEYGTGMGLAVVHGLVHSQKGHIQVDSELGVGTQIKVFFPLVDTVMSPQQVTLIPGLTMGQGRVLFVDDDEQVVEVAIELLKSLGYEVKGFVSSKEALGHFTDNSDRFDLLITDLTMPSLTGVELCEEVKKIRADLPVILCTGYSEKLTAEVLEEVGINRYCLKPLALHEFASVISEVLTASN